MYYLYLGIPDKIIHTKKNVNIYYLLLRDFIVLIAFCIYNLLCRQHIYNNTYIDLFSNNFKTNLKI